MSPDDPLVRGFGLFVVTMMVAAGVVAAGLLVGGSIVIRRGSRGIGLAMLGLGLFFACDLVVIGHTIGAW